MDLSLASATLGFMGTESPAPITTSVLDKTAAIIAAFTPTAPTLLGRLIVHAIPVLLEMVSIAQVDPLLSFPFPFPFSFSFPFSFLCVLSCLTQD